jgi:superfamily II RNA helicase
LVWSKYTEASKLPLTEHVASRLQVLEASLQLRFPLQLAPFSADRPLAFRLLTLKEETKLLPSGTTPREFLLEHCGPYLERSFDSAPDPRVPSFHPDAWQRKVLDAIDANKSVLAVAPTSAGKTFISFYAMKKVLQANDDDILVYVAPTKALVNQIAAEVQARFSKHYGSRAGKSVWAIHTRDYRVNSAKGCQVLVTVPSLLQIMLLAPVNAKRPNDWSNRIRRIIFDEVHCIGQADDGVVWEQLLLLAPCPIIALSATIANPNEFKAWLEQSQNAKGFELEMIVHSSRYSDLRKFIHDPTPAVAEFTGLEPVERLPLPGLDSEPTGGDNTASFLFVHPVASIVDKNRDTLNDTSLEPRDCLSLWRCMEKHQNPQYPLSPTLDPEKALPEAMQKSDVVKWEKQLKDQLGEWMVDTKSPFDAVRQELRGQRYSRLADLYSQESSSSSRKPPVKTSERWPEVSTLSVFSLVTDLRTSGALPAILFNYDREKCEAIVTRLFTVLVNAENHYRETSASWKAKLAEFEAWEKARGAAGAKSAKKAANSKYRGRRDDDDRQGKAHLDSEAADLEPSKWETFDPDAALAQFSFADGTKITSKELEERLQTIHPESVREPFIAALRRGVGVHHAGMNRQYRQV